MNLFIGQKVSGVRFGKYFTYDKFEIKFQALTETHLDLIMDALKKIDVQGGEVHYYLQYNMKLDYDCFSNSDKGDYFIWRKVSRDELELFIQREN